MKIKVDEYIYTLYIHVCINMYEYISLIDICMDFNGSGSEGGGLRLLGLLQGRHEQPHVVREARRCDGDCDEREGEDHPEAPPDREEDPARKKISECNWSPVRRRDVARSRHKVLLRDRFQGATPRLFFRRSHIRQTFLGPVLRVSVMPTSW